MTTEEWWQKYNLFCERIEQTNKAYSIGEAEIPSLSPDVYDKLPAEYQLAHPHYYPYAPCSFPPCGMEMPINVFCSLLEKHPDFSLPKYAWCATGKDIHDYLRKSYGYRTQHSIGFDTPRQGYYKIINEDGLCYYAYFNYREPIFAEFESQIVKISKKTLYSFAAISHDPLRVLELGDIMQVVEPTRRKTFISSEGDEIKVYQVIWKIIGDLN